jgi:hypothetical protein
LFIGCFLDQTHVLLLPHLQMAEAEDLRFSFDLSRGCSQELNLHCMYHLLLHQTAQKLTGNFFDSRKGVLLL